MKKKHKIFISIVSALLMCLVIGFWSLAAVGGSSGNFMWKQANEKSGVDFWKASYSYFEGWKKRGFEFSNDSNGQCILQVDITTVSGELDIIVMDAADQEIYSYKNLATSQFEIELENQGEYEIKIVGRGHNGSFDIKPGSSKQ